MAGRRGQGRGPRQGRQGGEPGQSARVHGDRSLQGTGPYARAG
jgi:hypothetical protein